jgi:hypothetical protein
MNTTPEEIDHPGDRFDFDCLRHQAVRGLRRFPGDSRMGPNWRASALRHGRRDRAFVLGMPI